GASNNTYGLQAKGVLPGGSVSFPYLAEIAYQTDGADSPFDYEVWYYHLDAAVKAGKVTVGIGLESLGSDNGRGFQTPLATLHAFNGWADLFLGTPATGLNDAYVYFNAQVAKNLAFKSQFHVFGKDSSDFGYGTEIDAALIYKVDKNFTIGAKYAQYFADDFGVDTSRFTFDIGFKF
ncbi:MAG: hypothetical protein AAF514_05010, partial [Verrucomicrobiota bacterium]